LLKKTTDKANGTIAYSQINTPIPLRICVADLAYITTLHGFNISDYQNETFEQGVLFCGEYSNNTNGLDLSALGTISAKNIKESGYQLLLDFQGMPYSHL
jgi:hypothetical protein